MECTVNVYIEIARVSFTGIQASEDAPILLYSLFSWGGLHGNATFSWAGHGTNVTMSIHLEYGGTDIPTELEDYDWAIYEMPIRYDQNQRCALSRLGRK